MRLKNLNDAAQRLLHDYRECQAEMEANLICGRLALGGVGMCPLHLDRHPEAAKNVSFLYQTHAYLCGQLSLSQLVAYVDVVASEGGQHYHAYKDKEEKEKVRSGGILLC